jgi:hypothetical protein
MDLSQLSKETLISIINDLQDQIKQLKQETTQTTIYDVDSKAESIPNEKPIPEFGNGPIRYKKDGKYYHGVGPKEEKYKWYKEGNNYKLGGIFGYRDKFKKVPRPERDFNIGTNFCTNCVCIEDNPRKGYIHFQCLGHPIE